MNPQTEERIRIIKKLKPSLGFNKQPLEKRIKKLRFFGILIYAMANILLIVIIIQSAITLFHLDPTGQSWNKSALMVFITLNLSLHSHYSYIEFLLLKHVDNIKNQEYLISYINNKELKELINNLNYHRFRPYGIIIPALLVMLGSILSYFDSNPYWEIFALPTLVIGTLMLWQLNYKVSQIRNNIEEIESKVVINSINS